MTTKRKIPAAPVAPKIGFVSLGCPKALVDSERILTSLRAEGYIFSQDYDGADVVIVNTCGFLDSARDESLSAIGDAMSENGKVIVTGCLGAEPDKILAKYPNVLAITGPQQYESVVDAVHKAAPPIHDPYVDLVPPEGIKLTPRHYAYLKISEGCNNRCTFCIIPKLRGDLVSRPIGNVMMEAERLVKAGVREILVISQDTSAYGIDVKYAPSMWRGVEYKTKFIDLATALGELGVWVRMHYVYPYPHVDDVIPLMSQGKILPYLDIPFQHAAPNVLRAMKRPASQDKVLERIKKWREICPDLTLRSTFIVGFPGETEEDFDILLNFMREAQIDRAGCFKYEDVVGADSNALPGQVSEEVKEDRFHRFMMVQQEVSAARLARKVGRTLPVILDEVGEAEQEEPRHPRDSKRHPREGGDPASKGSFIGIGRTMGDAPEIDGVVHISGLPDTAKPGDIVNVKITGSDEYDLVGSYPK